jgi:Fic-DOC domain mobile mystery protein B
VSDILDSPTGATPLTAGDFEGLIPTWIATKSDLNRAEQANIGVASVWAFDRKLKISDLTQGWLKNLHRRMFDEVWRWAGSYRQTDTNIGVPWYEIQTSVEQLILDVHAQTQNPDTQPWSIDEIAVRFHHRLVSIHPFPNGNGRHARLAADVIAIGLGGGRFGWGAGVQLYDVGPARDEYLTELRRADREGDYAGLIAFARRTAQV